MAYSADQLELLAVLEAARDKTVAWVNEDPENRFAGYATTDLDHWAECGVFSVADFERHELESAIWDTYKEAHGVRPRWMNMSEMSMDELRAEYTRLLREADEERSREVAREVAAAEAFEAQIAVTIEMGAADRETAIRWIREAYDDEDMIRRDGSFEYCNGLPYGYLKGAAA